MFDIINGGFHAVDMNEGRNESKESVAFVG